MTKERLIEMVEQEIDDRNITYRNSDCPEEMVGELVGLQEMKECIQTEQPLTYRQYIWLAMIVEDMGGF